MLKNRRSLALAAAGALGALVLTACGSDTGRDVGGVAADQLAATTPSNSSSTGSSTGAPAPAQSQPAAAVSALQVVEGTLQRDDDSDDDADDADDADDDRDDPADRYDDFTVNGVDVDFGPSEWIIAASELQDYDGDGTTEPFAAELDGLVGQQVTLQVRDDDDDDDDADDDAGERLDDADVYEVNGLALRDLTGPAPWRGGPAPSGPLAG